MLTMDLYAQVVQIKALFEIWEKEYKILSWKSVLSKKKKKFVKFLSLKVGCFNY